MGNGPSPLDPDAFRWAGTALAADRVTVEVAQALAVAGIECILLRGPAVAAHLYDASDVRPYVDTDLLVAAGDAQEAERALLIRGFGHHAVLGQRADDRPRWSSTWVRSRDGANVDLHWTLAGVRAAPDQVWRVLGRETETLRVLGAPIRVLSAAATVVVVALHAAHHGAPVRQPLRDLERAITRLSVSTWLRASALAHELDAVEAFAAGLRLLPAGAALARELALPDTASTETILRVGGSPPMALGFDWLAHTPGIRAKLRLIVGKVFPDAEFMRAWSPLARSGTKRGLAFAYAWRPIWLAWHSVPGFRAWLDARRRARS